MIVVALLEGYSSSLRVRSLEDVFYENLKHSDVESSPTVLSQRATLCKQRARSCRTFIKEHSNDQSALVCIGKSLGGRNLVKRVLNKLPKETLSTYKYSALLTIDPCWPKLTDWTPNLNEDRSLILKHSLDSVKNVYLMTGKKTQQAGAPLYLKEEERPNNLPPSPTINSQVFPPYTHYSIINCLYVAAAIQNMLETAAQKVKDDNC